MTQEQENNLIKLAQQGDFSARDEVFLAYGKLVRSIARSMNLVGADADHDDLFQIGCTGLLRAIDNYDEGGKASFKTYASHCIRNAILDELRKKSPIVTETLDGNNAASGIPSASTPEKDYIDSETVSTLYMAIQTVLSDTELTVFNLYLSGFSYQEISSRLAIEKKKVDNTLYSAKRKVKNLLNKD